MRESNALRRDRRPESLERHVRPKHEQGLPSHVFVCRSWAHVERRPVRIFSVVVESRDRSVALDPKHSDLDMAFGVLVATMKRGANGDPTMDFAHVSAL